MKDLHVELSYQGNPCQFDLVEGKKSDNSVTINGVGYAVVADEGQLATAKQVLSALSEKPIPSAEKLEGRLKKLANAENVVVTPNKVATEVLGTQPGFRAWRQEEQNNLPKTKEYVARTLWLNKESLSKRTVLRDFLGPEEFDKALQEKEPDAFIALFKDLSIDELWVIRNGENCQPKSYVKTTPYEITTQDRQNLKDYLDDIGFSGVVGLSDAKGTYYICPSKLESLEKLPFSIHSISKVLTGALALMTMPSTAFDKKLELPPDTPDLKEPLRKHIETEKPTLFQAMTHNAGFGDYLGEYGKALEEAAKNGKPLPEVKKPEDFLKYAETETYPMNSGRYSNLGILLVGLAIQHHTGRPFNQLLEEKILIPADVEISATKPENGKYNPADPNQGKAVGSPSGGHWATAENLNKVGIWLKDKCDTDPVFRSLIKKYGREFYVPEDKEIHHNGCSDSGSSFLSSFRQSGVTISVLSDQSDFSANRIYYTIREKMIEKD